MVDMTMRVAAAAGETADDETTDDRAVIGPTPGSDFTGRRVLVTGASRGIAGAIAQGLGARGAQVALHHSAAADEAAKRPNAAEDLARRIEEAGGGADLIDADLTREGAGQTLAEAARAQGPIDSVVLSASIQVHRPFLLQTAEDVARQLRINVTANIEILQALLPDMARRGFGRVLVIGSVQQTNPSPEMPIYALTKAALANLVENLAIQSAPRGITLNTLAPGLVETDRNAFRREVPGAWEEASRRANPIGRAAQPAEMVAPALYLLTRDSAMTTGATLYVTGGAHIATANGGNWRPLVLPDEHEG